MYIQMENLATVAVTYYDRQALAEIYERHSPGIFRYAYRLLGDQDMAEECVAETFSRFLQVTRSGGKPENAQAYLYRVAHNWVTDSYRRQPRLELLDTEMHADPLDNPASIAAENLEQERMRSALRRLPAEQRLVIALRFLDERSHEDVAAVLGKTVEASRALQHRALEALRRMLIERDE
jgi:RNA polymerase sigma-70 factor, ECF subfamily